MSNSVIATHQFIDADILEVKVIKYKPNQVRVYLNGEMDLVTLSKEDLLHLLKLIEETN